MKVAIVGSRRFSSLILVDRYIRALPPEDVVVTGGAKGVDEVAERVARETRRSREVHEPLVPAGATKDEYRRALLRRNAAIAVACDYLVAFWDGDSSGTLHAAEEARKLGKPVMIFRQDGSVLNATAAESVFKAVRDDIRRSS